VRNFIQLLGARWSDSEVEAAVWKMVGDAAAEGRLLVDLTEVELTLSTPLILLKPGATPILPDPLPSSLEKAEQEDADSKSTIEEDGDTPIEPQSDPLGTTFDDSSLGKEAREKFNRNLAAVRAVLDGISLRIAAEENEMAPATLSHLVKRARELGQLAS
jgi:hypothetical protein